MKKITRIIIVSSFLLVQCSSSNIVSTWQSSEVLNLKSGRIIVIGLIKESDKSLQKKMENHLADDLCNLGYDAVSSLELYGLNTFEGKDENQIMEQLKQNGTAAVLTIVLLNKQKEKYHAPKSMFDSEKYNSDFNIYYAAIYSKIYEEGYYVNDTYYFWESSLFTMPDQKIIYSVQTQSFNPLSTASLAHEYGKLIIRDMLAHNIIKNLYKKNESFIKE
jgi:hypothetical protein